MTDKRESSGYPGLDANIQAMIDDGWTYEELRTDEGRILLLTRGDDRVKLNVAVATALGLSTMGGLRAFIGVTTPTMTCERRNRMGQWIEVNREAPPSDTGKPE